VLFPLFARSLLLLLLLLLLLPLQEGLDAATARAVISSLLKFKRAPEKQAIRAKVQRFKGE